MPGDDSAVRTTSAAPSGRGRLLRDVSAADLSGSRMGQFAASAAARYGREFASYEDLWSWSVNQPDEFWARVVEFFGLGVSAMPAKVVSGTMPDVTWLPGARLNYARELLRTTGPGPAVIGVSQTRPEAVLTWDELRRAVGACRVGLQRLGVGRGDCVAAYMPNVPETMVLLIAAASLGATFASCPPEFGSRAVLDRFAQVAPKVLVASDGYVYGKRTVSRAQTVADLAVGLVGLDAVVIHRYADTGVHVETGHLSELTWDELLAADGELDYEDVPFDHPLYVLFSSGSTGRPKAIVHGHGGILLEHAKALGLHNDVRHGDRFFWYATTGWMVWNYGVSALMHGASVICYDGNPSYPDALELWRVAERVGATFFGTSATHIMMSAAKGISPRAEFGYGSLRSISSTGSPLPAAGFVWLDEHVSTTAHLSSVSGGTDVCSGFVGGSPLVPTRAGELSAPMLGCDAHALDESGHEVIGAFGELCVLGPMPSMPVSFVNDPDRSRLRDAYYDRFPRVWAHGDWIIFYQDRASVIAGRSDTTLNRAGVRLGTADIYGVIDTMPGIDDSLVVHLEDVGGLGGTLLLLVTSSTFPAHEQGTVESAICRELREQLSPRHVPDVVAWAPALPRTLTGKKLEKPVKQLLLGASPESVASADSLTSATDFARLVGWLDEFRGALR